MRIYFLIIMLLFINSGFAQKKRALTRDEQALVDIVDDITIGPLPKLNGTWYLYELEVNKKSFHAQKVKQYINDEYKNQIQQLKPTVAVADTTGLYAQVERRYHNILLLSLNFNARYYTSFINAMENHSGKVKFNATNDEISLIGKSSNFTYTINAIQENKLVLTLLDDDRKPLGKFIFKRDKW